MTKFSKTLSDFFLSKEVRNLFNGIFRKSSWETRSIQFTDNLGAHITGFSEFVEETKKGYSIPTWQEKNKKNFKYNFHFDSF